MHQGVFSEISLIIAIATGIALIMRLIKQPLLIGYIVSGIIVGPGALDLIHNEATITVFSKLGIALLLFIVGLGLNPKVIKEVGRPAVLAGMGQITFTTTMGFFVCTLLLNFPPLESFIVSLAIAFSSTIIFLKLISDKKEQNRLYARIAIGVLLVQDIAATLSLLVLSASASENGLSVIVFLTLLGKAFGGVIFLWLVGAYILPHLKNLIAGSQEFLFIFALGWGLGIASIFEKFGFSLEVGALIAGVGLASQTYAQEISARLRPLRDFFIVVFFIYIGSELMINDIGSILMPALALSLLIIIGNPFIIMVLLGLLGYTRRMSFKVGIGMAQISEFSLVFAILAQQQGKLTDSTFSVLALVALITMGLSTYMILYADKLYDFFEDHFHLFENKKVKYDQSQAGQYDIILFGYRKGGSEFVKAFKEMKKKFVVIDYNPEVIDTLEQQKIHYLYGDATDIEMLDEVGVHSAKLVASVIDDHEINMFITTHVRAESETAVIICSADDESEAKELYEHGASYVIMSHTIGSEKLGSFIKKNGFKQSEFNKFRDKHLSKIEN